MDSTWMNECVAALAVQRLRCADDQLTGNSFRLLARSMGSMINECLLKRGERQMQTERREKRSGVSGIHFRLALTSLVAANARQLPARVTQQRASRCPCAHIAHTQRATARQSLDDRSQWCAAHSCAGKFSCAASDSLRSVQSENL